MATSTTKIGIVNRGLQLLGYPSISSIQENSKGARAMNRAYDSVKLSELRKHFWNFSIKRAQLPASATPPEFGKSNYFPLPGDFLMLAPDDQVPGGYPIQHDWQIEGNQIASDESPPLLVRYVSSDLLESLFDVNFAEALSAALAIATCEELTNSNVKMQNLQAVYDAAIKMARKRNAFENPAVNAPLSSWISARV